MDAARFEQMVARLEQSSSRAPRAYKIKVALLALLGLGVLALLVGVAGLGLLLLAGVALALLFSGGNALILLFKLGKLLLLLAVPLWLLVRSATRALLARLPAPEGRALSRREAPALFAALDQMRLRLRGPRVHHVLLVDEMNAAVVQRPLLGLLGWPRNYLLLGLPLLESLGPEEALAVVAHEYGHLAGSHGRFGAFIYRLRLSWSAMQQLAEQWQGLAGRLMKSLVGWYAPYFNAYTFVLARANEYEADRASADLVGAEAAARALKRVNLAGPRHEAFLGETFGRAAELALPPADLALRWSETAPQAAMADEAGAWLRAALARPARPFDTHPGLADRLSALPGQAGQLETLPPAHEGPSAAGAWLGAALPGLRREFDSAWCERMAGPWRQRHEEVQAQRQELATLQGLEAPDGDQRWRMLRLQELLALPGFEPAAAYAAFNAAEPGHAAGLFYEGLARLHQGDERGLALLEQAMQIDEAATLPACEAAWQHLQARADERAADYARRWQARQDFEQGRQRELERLDLGHELRAPDLPADLMARLRALLPEHGLAEVYLARRVLPSDPRVPTYVLGVRCSWMNRLLRRRARVMQQLSQLDWPLHLFLVPLEGQRKLARRLRKIPGARLH